jgi:hypothetical protein
MENYRNSGLRNTLLSKSWEGLRVKYNYDYMPSGFPHAKVNFLKQALMEPTKALFRNLLKVKRNPNGV